LGTARVAFPGHPHHGIQLSIEEGEQEEVQGTQKNPGIDPTELSWENSSFSCAHRGSNVKREETMESRLISFFNEQPRIGVLSTANREGKVNAGVFASPMMLDEQTVIMGLGQNRTLQNLQENPHAAFTIVKPGETLQNRKGLRVYLKMHTCEKEGKQLDQIRSRIAAMAGETAARNVVACVIFQVTEVRPLVDSGQEWENSL
jgi:hypothetical protein